MNTDGSTWYFIAARYDVDGLMSINVFEEGESVDAAAVLANAISAASEGPLSYAGSSTLLALRDGGGDDQDLQGSLDDVAFFNTVLTDAEIADVFNFGAGAKPIDNIIIPEPDTIFIWIFSAMSLPFAMLLSRRRRRGGAT